jgi:hypothetical protein
MKAQVLEGLSHYPWEAVLTIRTGQDAHDEQAAYELIQTEVIRPLMRQLNTKIAGIGAHNRLHSPHAHILLFSEHGVLQGLGNQSLYNRLYDPDNKIITHLKAVDIKPYRDGGAISYMLDNLPIRSGKGGLLYFNAKLLNQTLEVSHAA